MTQVYESHKIPDFDAAPRDFSEEDLDLEERNEQAEFDAENAENAQLDAREKALIETSRLRHLTLSPIPPAKTEATHVHFSDGRKPVAAQPAAQKLPSALKPALRKNTDTADVPAELLTLMKGKVHAYLSLVKIGRVAADGEAHHFSSVHMIDGYEHEDADIGFEEFVAASDLLVKAMALLNKSCSKLFATHFTNVKEMYTAAFWPVLRVYDIRVRLMHLGDTSSDLISIDKRLLGTILIEDAHESLHNFAHDHQDIPTTFVGRSQDEYDDETLVGDADGPVPENEVVASPLGVASDASPTADMSRFLDEIYGGAGEFAESFVDFGVASPAALAEVCMLDPAALDELITSIATESGMKPFIQVVLKAGLRRRFGSQTGHAV